MHLKDLLGRIDCWLCINLKPWRLRLWWHRLWIRCGTYHPSRDFSQNIYHAIKKSYGLKWFEECDAAERYYKDVNHRRCIANDRSIQTPVMMKDS